MDMDTDSNNKFVHPLFHINFGGRELEESIDTGDILLIRSPRLMHPPLDIFLAIDFVIQNFFGLKHQIYQDFEYRRIIDKYRKLHWGMYSNAFASYFTNPSPNTFSRQILGFP